MATPKEFKTIRLNLARSKEFPEGSAKHGYTLVAPLDAANPKADANRRIEYVLNVLFRVQVTRPTYGG